MPLVNSRDFNQLPLEPVNRWLALRDLVEKRLEERTDNEFGSTVADLIDYWSTLKSAADELKLGQLPELQVFDVRENIDHFRAAVIELATKLSLRSQTANNAVSVSLSRPTRKEVLLQIETLRTSIANATLPEKTRRRADATLNDLHMQIVAPRTNIAQVGLLLATLGGVVGGSVSTLADLPAALGTIATLIGVDKEEEEAEKILIGSSPIAPQLEDLRGQANDDIPF